MTLAKNPRAKFDYEILETLEAGLVLTGQEVKSARAGNLSLKGAHAVLAKNELWLLNMHIGAYKKAGVLGNYDPTHSRRLLIHKSELKKLIGTLQSKGLTLIPVSVYTSGRRLKVELGLARGKKKHEKRETIKKRDVDREIRRKLLSY